MDILTVVLAMASIIFLIEYLTQRAARRTSTLAAAGLAAPRGTAPPMLARLLPVLRERLTWLGKTVSPRPGEDLERLIAESGARYSTFYFQGIRVSAGLAAAVLALPLGLAALPLIPVFFAFGYQLPVIILKRRRRLRMEKIASDLPEIVDLMAVLCFSGESLFQALRHSAAACGHLSSRDEIEFVLERIRMGESTAEALRHAVHHPCREMRRFSRTLLRAEEYGAPIAETLEELATELRSGRREKERVRASRASVFILFPLVFLILPSFLLLTVGGMILGYTL